MDSIMLYWAAVISCLLGQSADVPIASTSPPSAEVIAPTQAQVTLRALLAANITNSTQFPKGQLSARLRTDRGLINDARVVDMRFRWSGQSIACDYLVIEHNKNQESPEWNGPPTEETVGITRLIMAPGANTALFQTANALGTGSQPRLTFFTAGRESLDTRDYQMRPDQAWFNLDRLMQIRALLETLISGGGKSDSLVRIDGDRVILGDKNARERQSSVIEFSLSQGGNAVKHVNWARNSTRNEYGARGSWTWAQLPDQRWYLKSLEDETWSDELQHPRAKELYETNRAQRPNFYDPDWKTKPSWKIRLDIYDFDPNPQWDVDPFNPSHWNVSPGTFVEDKTGSTVQRYRFGNGDADPTSEINALVERLKKRSRARL